MANNGIYHTNASNPFSLQKLCAIKLMCHSMVDSQLSASMANMIPCNLCGVRFYSHPVLTPGKTIKREFATRDIVSHSAHNIICNDCASICHCEISGCTETPEICSISGKPYAEHHYAEQFGGFPLYGIHIDWDDQKTGNCGRYCIFDSIVDNIVGKTGYYRHLKCYAVVSCTAYCKKDYAVEQCDGWYGAKFRIHVRYEQRTPAKDTADGVRCLYQYKSHWSMPIDCVDDVVQNKFDNGVLAVNTIWQLATTIFDDVNDAFDLMPIYYTPNEEEPIEGTSLAQI